MVKGVSSSELGDDGKMSAALKAANCSGVKMAIQRAKKEQLTRCELCVDRCFHHVSGEEGSRRLLQHLQTYHAKEPTGCTSSKQRSLMKLMHKSEELHFQAGNEEDCER